MTERLKHWKNVLNSNVEDWFPSVLKLENESKVLRDFHVVDVEVPGQYFSDQVRMVEDDLMYSTFLEAYENSCPRNDRESHLPITYFKQKLNQAISGQISPEGIMDLRLQAYNEIKKSFVSDSIFSQYMYKTLPSGNHKWAFKKQFAIQLAVSSFMSFMLQIGGRSPNKIHFAKSTGKIFQADFHSSYDVNGMIEFSEPVPFRPTRSMQAFFSQFGVEGLIVSAMSSAAQAVVSPKVCPFDLHYWMNNLMSIGEAMLIILPKFLIPAKPPFVAPTSHVFLR